MTTYTVFLYGLNATCIDVRDTDDNYVGAFNLARGEFVKIKTNKKFKAFAKALNQKRIPRDTMTTLNVTF